MEVLAEPVVQRLDLAPVDDRPAGLPWSQPLNMFLTLGQTRYLLNASDFDGKGYLNMQLTEDQATEVKKWVVRKLEDM